MKIFKVNENIEVVCEYEKTRNGFRHLATLIYNGRDVETVKCTYQNRTWERYEFQTVLGKLADTSEFLSDEERTLVNNFAKSGE